MPAVAIIQIEFHIPPKAVEVVVTIRHTTPPLINVVMIMSSPTAPPAVQINRQHLHFISKYLYSQAKIKQGKRKIFFRNIRKKNFV